MRQENLSNSKATDTFEGAIVFALIEDPSFGAAALLVVALGEGFAFAVAIYSSARVSGGQVNPVVTLGMVLVGRIEILTAIFYWIAQFGGAIIATLILKSITPFACKHLPR
jgi:glycerol uptake facilitator-like aquaporin